MADDAVDPHLSARGTDAGPRALESTSSCSSLEVVQQEPVAEYLDYASRQLQIAREKLADAPASSATHELQAAAALRLCRVPKQGEAMADFVTECDELSALKARAEQAEAKALENTDKLLREMNHSALLQARLETLKGYAQHKPTCRYRECAKCGYSDRLIHDMTATSPLRHPFVSVGCACGLDAALAGQDNHAV